MSGLSAVVSPRLTGTLGIANRFMHTCTVQREQGHSAYDDPGSAAAHLTGQPCLYVAQRATERQSDGAVVIVESIAFPAGTDVTEGDIVTSVTDQNGDERIASARDVESVLNHGTHIETVLTGAR